tara:strand:- start:85 stop:1008 length:924 start_codon:yes stop_codon:yes gene_type:complete
MTKLEKEIVKNAKKGTNWSSDEIDCAVEQDKNNVSYAAIGEMIDRSAKAVRQKLFKIKKPSYNKADLPPLKSVVKKNNPIDDMLAPKPLTKKSFIPKGGKVKNRKYSTEENQIVLRMLGSFTIEEILERLNTVGALSGSEAGRSYKGLYAKIRRIYFEATHTLAASLENSQEYRPVGDVKDSAYERMNPKKQISRKELLDELGPSMDALFGTDYEKSDDKPDDEHWQNQKVNPISERHVELKTWHKPRINLSSPKEEPLSLKPRDIVPEPMVQVTSTEMNALLKAVEGLKPTEEPKKKGFFRRLFSG